MILQRSQFLAALEAVKPFSTSKMLPMFACVRMSMDGARLRLECNDLDAYRKTVIDCHGSIDTVLVDVKKLADIVKALPLDPVTVEVDAKSNVTISSGRSSTKLLGMSDAGWQDRPEIKGGDSFGVDADYLANVDDRIGFAIATDVSRYGLTGACLEMTDAGRRWVATDGHRLSWTGDVEPEGTVRLLPRRFLREGGKMGAGTVTVSAERAVLVSGDDELSCRVLEGDFPDYRQVLPSRPPEWVEVQASDLSAALKRVMLMANDKTRSVRIEVDDVAMRVSASQVDVGDASDEVFLVSPVSRGFKLSLNARFLLDALDTCDGVARIGLFDGHRPAIIQGKNCTHVIMPMRMEE